MVCTKTQGLYWFGPLTLCPVHRSSCIMHQFTIHRGLQTGERGIGVPSLWCERECASLASGPGSQGALVGQSPVVSRPEDCVLACAHVVEKSSRESPTSPVHLLPFLCQGRARRTVEREREFVGPSSPSSSLTDRHALPCGSRGGGCGVVLVV